MLKVRDISSASGVAFGTSGVRGLASSMNAYVCDAFMQGFLALEPNDGRGVLIGCDLRESSPAIAQICHASASKSGWNTHDAGRLPTPALAFAAQEVGLPAVMVTGSHIPESRNGLKFYRNGAEISKEDEQGILLHEVTSRELELTKPVPQADKSILQRYSKRYLGILSDVALRGMRIGVYEHSSVARYLLHDVLRGLGAETVPLGRSESFVALDTEAISDEVAAVARRWIRIHALDAIVTTDGDADRPLIADELGQWLRGDIVGILSSAKLGARSVVTPLTCTTALERCGVFAEVVRTKIGSPHVLSGMAGCSLAPIVGFEPNGGLIIGSDVSFEKGTLKALKTRDALLPILLVLMEAKSTGSTLSELAGSLPSRHTASERLQNVDPAACREMLSKIEADKTVLTNLLGQGTKTVLSVDPVDGIRATFVDGDIVHLRLREMRRSSDATRSLHQLRRLKR